MSIVKLMRFLRGYVRFTARSGSAERLLNLCAREGIPVRGCSHVNGKLTGYTTVEGYHRMRTLARRAGTSTRVTERHGLPFVVYRYRRRSGILAGAALFVLLLAIAQQFVWVVRVEGCEQLEPQVLLNAMEEMGVHRGVRKSAIEPLDVREELVLKIDELSWAALNIRGTTATLLVRERAQPPPKIDTNTPANLVAARDGQIKQMEITDGHAVLRVGDTVREGDLIASGVYEDRWGLTHLVRANGRVTAQVMEVLEVKVPLMQQTLYPTGETLRRRYIELFGLRLPLFLYSAVDGEYKLERVTTTPELLGLRLPFEISSDTYLFYTREQQKISEETAMREAQRRMQRREKAQWEGKLIQVNRTAQVKNGVLVLTGDYLIEEDIARQVEISVPEAKKQGSAGPKRPREGGY